jgi:hypothetical protein
MSSRRKSVNPFAQALADLLAAASAQWGESSEEHYAEVEARHTAARRAAPAGVCVPPLDEAGLPTTCRRVTAVFTAGGVYDEAENHPIAVGNEERWRTWQRIVEGLRSAAVLAAVNGQGKAKSPKCRLRIVGYAVYLDGVKVSLKMTPERSADAARYLQ